MEKYLTKSNIKGGLVMLTALLNFLVLLFTVVEGEHITMSGEESFFANGFTLAFSDCPPICEALENWLSFYSRFHFFISLALVLALTVAVFVTGRLRFGGYGVAAVIFSLITSLIYMINGIAANALAADYASSIYYTHYTLAPLGFALVLISALGLLLVHLFISEDGKQ